MPAALAVTLSLIGVHSAVASELTRNEINLLVIWEQQAGQEEKDIIEASGYIIKEAISNRSYNEAKLDELLCIDFLEHALSSILDYYRMSLYLVQMSINMESTKDKKITLKSARDFLSSALNLVPNATATILPTIKTCPQSAISVIHAQKIAKLLTVDLANAVLPAVRRLNVTLPPPRHAQ